MQLFTTQKQLFVVVVVVVVVVVIVVVVDDDDVLSCQVAQLGGQEHGERQTEMARCSCCKPFQLS